jgi:hypothetical protein
MEKPESSWVILSTLNLDDIEEAVQEAYHRDGSVHLRENRWVFSKIDLEKASAGAERTLC